MLNGSFTLLLTGLALVTVEELEADRLNYVKIAIKLADGCDRRPGGQEPEVRHDPARTLGPYRRPHHRQCRSGRAMAVRSIVG